MMRKKCYFLEVLCCAAAGVEISNEEMTQKSYRAATRHWTQSSFSLHRGSRTKKNIKK